MNFFQELHSNISQSASSFYYFQVSDMKEGPISTTLEELLHNSSDAVQIVKNILTKFDCENLDQ